MCRVGVVENYGVEAEACAAKGVTKGGGEAQ